MHKTKYYSWATGKLAEGCLMCVKGRKLVLFVTGICPKNCWYCPLSEQKKSKDVVFANEWKISSDNDLIREAELCSSTGAGITGGDPLLRIERTVKYIKMLKKRFGRKFHIHLYAPLNNITREKLAKLYNAGLDEIRVHPDFYSRKYWERIGIIREFGWSVGMEIPAIPTLGNETISSIEYFLPYLDFININELEQSETNADEMLKRGLRVKSELDYGIKGSHEMAIGLLKRYGKKIRMHYCTTKLKDAVQLAKRIKMRSKKAKEQFDSVTNEGMLVRGAIYLPELMPGFGYRKKIEGISGKKRKDILKKLEKTMNLLSKKYKITKSMIKVDEKKLRILTSEKTAKKISEKSLKPAIVTEYPTWDATEIEVEFI